jgi:hypothetical protein
MTNNEAISIPSPLGDFQVLLQRKGKEIEHLKCGEAFLENFHIETSLNETNPQLLDGCEVNGTYLLSIHIKAQQPLEKFSILCVCKGFSQLIEGGHDSGQYFDAQTWNNDTHTVTLGTQGDDFLAECTEKGKQIPSRFKEDINSHYMLEWIEYLENGLSISVPRLETHESVSLYFSLSWNNKPDDEECSTWFAAFYTLP